VNSKRHSALEGKLPEYQIKATVTANSPENLKNRALILFPPG